MPPGVFHFDADAFFAAVEQASDPRLRGKPVAVGGEKRGIIASASYEARKFGVYTPMPTARARRLCPQLILIPGDYEKYERFSQWMFSYLHDFTPFVEATSIDEGYADFTGARKPPLEIAKILQKAIRDSLKISVSEGLGANKLVSQVASKLRKPGGLIEVPAGEERDFLAPLRPKWLPGVGPKTEVRLDAAGFSLVRQIADTPADLLHLVVGSQAPQLREFALGIDPRPLVLERPAAQSYGQQETFDEDVTDEARIEATLHRMADELCAKLRADGQMARTLTVKVRYNDFAEDQRAQSLTEPTDLEHDLYGRLRPLLREAWCRRVSLRLVSLRLSNLYPTLHKPELSLFPNETNRAAQRRLADAVDTLRETRGRFSVMRGHDLLLREEIRTPKPDPRGPPPPAPAPAPTSALPPAAPARIPQWEPAGDPVFRARAVAMVRPEEGGRRKLEVGSGKSEGGSSNAELKSRTPGVEVGSGKSEGGSGTAESDSRTPISELRSPNSVPRSPIPPARRAAAVCAMLNVRSHFSFLDSTLSPRRIAELAVRHGCPAVALTDPGLHGAVPFHQTLKAAGVKPVIGATLRVDGKSLLLFVENNAGYANLCTLLTRLDGRAARFRAEGQRAEGRGRRGGALPVLQPGDFASTGLIAVASDPALRPCFAPGSFFLGATNDTSAERWARLRPDLPVAAVPPVHHADAAERRFYQVLQGMRTLTLLDAPHPDKRRGDASFRSAEEMARLFSVHGRALDLAGEIAGRCAFDFDYSRLQFPSWRPPDGTEPGVFLAGLVERGLRVRYGARAAGLGAQVREELAIIREVGYEEYFLAVWDLLQSCRERGIEWITRGSAADSLVCYCLGISDVCPVRFDLYFRRFLNRERMKLNKLPDIDLDFPHDRRADVADLVFAKFGRERTAVVGGFSTFQSRSAFAEIAKVLGVSEHQVRRVTEKIPRVRASEIREYTRASLEFADLPLEEEPFKTAFELADRLDGVPRHAKQHPCGIVISRGPMSSLMPCFTSASGYPTTHGDMDAVEAIGLVKIDILAQGGLAVMRDALEAVHRKAACPVARSLEIVGTRDSNSETRTSDLSPLPPELRALEPWTDPEVWALIAGGQGRGVHHIESPAMIGLAQNLNCRDIDTLIAMVSVIRPGAANEQKKQRFARRHNGLEPVELAHPSLRGCLGGTYGLVVYEEQILQICEAFAGLDPGKADILRRSLVKRDLERANLIGRDFVACARARGRTEDEIRTVWELVCGFNGYAFCKAHSTAYGVEAYHAAWLKRYHPAEFMAAVLRNGKGFYDPLVYVLESLRLGIPLRRPCVNGPDHFEVVTGADGAPAIATPLARINGLCARTLARAARGRPFAGVRDFIERTRPDRDEAEALLRAGALDSFGPSRAALFWELLAALRANAGSGERESGNGDRRSEFGVRESGAAFELPTSDFPLPTSTPGVRESGSAFELPPSDFRLPTSLFPPDPVQLPPVELTEPTPRQRLQAEMDLLGFTVSGHPLDLHEGVDWASYCPVKNLLFHVGRVVTCCGLVVEGRTTHQVTGETMKFMTIADHTGMIETELFSEGYKRFGLATVRHPVLEVTAVVEPFSAGRGYSLRILRAGPPRGGDRAGA